MTALRKTHRISSRVSFRKQSKVSRAEQSRADMTEAEVGAVQVSMTKQVLANNRNEQCSILKVNRAERIPGIEQLETWIVLRRRLH